LGIGANTTIFNIVDTIYLRPLPVRNPEQLASVSTRGWHKELELSSYADFLDIRNQVASFSEVLAHGTRGAILNLEGEGEMDVVDVVSPNYFSVFGVQPAQGRFFSPHTTFGEGEENAVVISYDLWQRRFHGSRDVVGKIIQLSGKGMMVAGIAPRHFHGMDRVGSIQLWTTPRGWETMTGSRGEFVDRENRWLELVARLRPGASAERARSELAVVAARLAAGYPASNKETSFALKPESDRRRQVQGTAFYVLAMVSLVLLIACANVAGFLLARSEQRRREFAMRRALGAQSSRVVRQLLTESFLLALLGAAGGVFLAHWTLQALSRFLSAAADLGGLDLLFDRRAALYAGGCALATIVLFGLYPALQSTRGNLTSILKREEPGASQSSRFFLKNLLVISEIALSVVLMVAAGLLVRGYHHSQRIHPGFESQKKVLLIELAPPELYGLSQQQTMVLFNQFADGIRAIPGVVRASFARRPPLTQNEMGETKSVCIPGLQYGLSMPPPKIRYNIVAPGYFETMGTRVVEGRPFDSRDTKGAPDAVLINETMARRYWPGESAVGRWLLVGEKSYQVAGVAEDGKYLTLHESPQPYLYFSFLQEFSSEVLFLAEIGQSSAPIANDVFRVARRLRAEIPVTDIRTLEQHVSSSLAEERFSADLFGLLGGIAVFLATIGLCGVISYLVNARLSEFSIRMALGATPRDILGIVIGRSLKLILLGLLPGIAIAMACSRFLSQALFGINPWDIAAYTGSAAAVVLITVIAALVPAGRVTRIHPMEVLRHH